MMGRGHCGDTAPFAINREIEDKVRSVAAVPLETSTYGPDVAHRPHRSCFYRARSFFLEARASHAESSNGSPCQ